MAVRWKHATPTQRFNIYDTPHRKRFVRAVGGVYEPSNGQTRDKTVIATNRHHAEGATCPHDRQCFSHKIHYHKQDAIWGCSCFADRRYLYTKLRLVQIRPAFENTTQHLGNQLLSPKNKRTTLSCPKALTPPKNGCRKQGVVPCTPS